MLTKLDLLALLEVLWHDTDLVQFIDVIPPGEYSKADAVYCYLLLLGKLFIVFYFFFFLNNTKYF